MKRTLVHLLTITILLTCISARGQEEQDSTRSEKWQSNVSACLYFMKDDFIFLPTYKLDHNWMHLEARYNYEDMNTFSAWAGYNISGGKAFEYTFTPMLGGIVGSTNGIAPGLEVTLGFKGIELYTEMEYVFDLQDNANDFYYSWTDLSYSPTEWLYFGISVQRTKLLETDLDIQRGLLLGGSIKRFSLTGYLFNMFFDDPYLVLALSISF